MVPVILKPYISYRAYIKRDLHLCCILQVSERKIMSLIRNLDNLRPMKDKQPSQRLDAVIEVVNAINLARGAEAQGCDSYVSTEYVSLIPDIA